MKLLTWCALCFCFFFSLMSCGEKNQKPTKENLQVSAAQLEEINKYLLEKDNDLIKAYMKRRGWHMTETHSGLWYMVYEKSSGALCKPGDQVEITYTLELLDGTPCYSSDELGTKKIIAGKGSLEPGLEEGILLLGEGDKARFILRPHLAHNLLGDEECVPARAVVVYDVQLLKIY